MTRDLDTHWKLHWVLVSLQGHVIWTSFMTWIRLTTHWVVSDCDPGKVSVCTPIRDCRVTYAHGWMHMCVEFLDEILLRRGECETPRKSNFLKKGQMVISVKIKKFSRSRMTKRTRLAKSSYHVEFRRIPRQSEFHVFRGTGCQVP